MGLFSAIIDLEIRGIDMKFLKYFLICQAVAVLLFTSIGNLPAFAQEGTNVTYDNVRLWVNPEYDDPRLLVMMQGQVNGFQAPMNVRFLVPSTAVMYSAGSMDANGKYSGGPPDRKPSTVSGWDEISYNLQTDTFRVEYYNPIAVEKPERTISYEFRSVNPISRMSVTIQQPRRSSNFSVTPAGTAAKDSEGFDVYTYNYSNVDPQSPLQLVISYSKQGSNVTLYVVIGIIVVVVIGIIGFVSWCSRARHNNRAQRRRNGQAKIKGTATGKRKKGATLTKTESKPVKKPQTNVCPECGEEIGNENCCPNCGTYLS